MASKPIKKEPGELQEEDVFSKGDLGMLGLKWNSVCKTCGSSGIYINSQRRRHIIDLHTQMQPFSCSKCGWARSDRSSVAGHIRQSHGDELGVKIVESLIDEKLVGKLLAENFLNQDIQGSIINTERRKTVATQFFHQTALAQSPQKRKERSESSEPRPKRAKSVAVSDSGGSEEMGVTSRSLHVTPKRKSMPKQDHLDDAVLKSMFSPDCFECKSTACGRTMKERKDHCLKKHMNVEPWLCSECGYRTMQRDRLVDHARQEHLHAFPGCITVYQDYNKEKLKSYMRKCFLKPEFLRKHALAKVAIERHYEYDANYKYRPKPVLSAKEKSDRANEKIDRAKKRIDKAKKKLDIRKRTAVEKRKPKITVLVRQLNAVSLFHMNCQLCVANGRRSGKSRKERMEHCLPAHMQTEPWACTKCDKKGRRHKMVEHAMESHQDFSAQCIVPETNYDKDKLNQFIKKCFLQKEHWPKWHTISEEIEKNSKVCRYKPRDKKSFEKKKHHIQQHLRNAASKPNLKLAADRVKRIRAHHFRNARTALVARSHAADAPRAQAKPVKPVSSPTRTKISVETKSKSPIAIRKPVTCEGTTDGKPAAQRKPVEPKTPGPAEVAGSKSPTRGVMLQKDVVSKCVVSKLRETKSPTPENVLDKAKALRSESVRSSRSSSRSRSSAKSREMRKSTDCSVRSQSPSTPIIKVEQALKAITKETDECIVNQIEQFDNDEHEMVPAAKSGEVPALASANVKPALKFIPLDDNIEMETSDGEIEDTDEPEQILLEKTEPNLPAAPTTVDQPAVVQQKEPVTQDPEESMGRKTGAETKLCYRQSVDEPAALLNDSQEPVGSVLTPQPETTHTQPQADSQQSASGLPAPDLNESTASSDGGIFPRMHKFLNGAVEEETSVAPAVTATPEQESNIGPENDSASCSIDQAKQEQLDKTLLYYQQKLAVKTAELEGIEAELKALNEEAPAGEKQRLVDELKRLNVVHDKAKYATTQAELFVPFIGVEEYMKKISFEATLPLPRAVPYTRYKWFGWSFGTVDGNFIVVREQLAILFGATSCHVFMCDEVGQVDIVTAGLKKCNDVDKTAVMQTATKFATDCVLDKDFVKEEYKHVVSDDYNWVCLKVCIKDRDCLAIKSTFDNDLCKILVFKDFKGLWIVDRCGRVEPIRKQNHKSC